MYAGRLSHHMARALLPEAAFLGAERIVEVIGRTSKSKIFGSNVPAIELANVIRKPFSLIHSHPPHYITFTVIPGLCHPTPIHHLYSPSRILSRDSANRKYRSQTTSSKRRRHRCRRQELRFQHSSDQRDPQPLQGPVNNLCIGVGVEGMT